MAVTTSPAGPTAGCELPTTRKGAARRMLMSRIEGQSIERVLTLAGAPDCPDGGCEATTWRCSVASGVWSGVSLECPAAVRLASERSDRSARSCRGVARKRNGIDHVSGVPAAANPTTREEHIMFMIGIDPHKGSHTAVAVDRSETVVDTIRVDADRHQRSRLLE